MNHSCDPNCITQKWTVNGDTRVGLFAIKDITPGAELTFNYQFETVGDNKKACMCGAGICSGLIGEKPQNNKEKKETDKKVLMKKNKKKKKAIKSKSPSPAPEVTVITDTPSPGRVKYEKMYEEFCFRCGEEGNCLPCDRELCPKVYHPLCVGKDAWPQDKWMCPWHFCAKCQGNMNVVSWCRHCPTAYCAEHADGIQIHPELGALCGDHDDEDMEF